MKTYWRKEGLELAQVTGGGEGKKEGGGGDFTVSGAPAQRRWGKGSGGG